MNIKQAKEIQLVDFLERLGHSPARQSSTQAWYLSPFRGEQTASFKVNTDRNLWFDFGMGEGGDIINLVQELERIQTIPETLSRIDAIMGGASSNAVPRPARTPVTKELKFEVTSIGRLKSKLLFAYLRRRGIDPKRALPYVKEASYTVGDSKHVALAFANDLGGYDLRSVHSKLTHGSKAIRTIGGRASVVQVFEGFFDFLTILMLPQSKDRKSTIVLNSVSMRDKAVAVLKQLNSTRVELYRDRDQAGESLLHYFVEALPGVEIVDMSDLYQGYNDLNEWHVANHLPAVKPTDQAA